jgi:NitT/TauT family transport system permease protein/taurine transport system permease protein
MVRRVGIKVLTIVGVLAIWQAVCSFGLVSQIILASPLSIAQAFASSGNEFLQAFKYTFLEILIAVSTAWVLGVATGALLGASPVLARATAPLLSSIFAIPFIVWYPILLVWLGIGPQSKITYGIAAGFFPIALNTLSAVENFDRRFVVLARSLGAGVIPLFFKFILPLTLPSIVSGLRIGTSFAVIAVLVSEMLASTAGIGFLISYHRTLFDTGHVYLGIALALACTVLVNVALTHVERRVGRWRDLERSSR